MSNDSGFNFDMSDFDRRFLDLALTTVPKVAEDALFDQLALLKSDADNEPPKTPYKDGNLRSDFDMILEGITQSKVISSGSKGRGGKPAERYGAKDIVVSLVMRMPYAAKWHEAIGKIINWTQDRAGGGVGPKYLETKMVRHKNKYFSNVANVIKAALKS